MKNNGKAMAKAGKKTFLRLIRTIFGFFPVLMPLVLIGILFNAIVGSIPAVFMQKVIAVVEQNWQSGDWNGCKDEILRYTGILLTLYGLALAASGRSISCHDSCKWKTSCQRAFSGTGSL